MDAPGEKLLIKLWESIADKGIATLLKPWQIRREGRATTEVRTAEMLALAQAEVYAAAIRSGEKLLLPDGMVAATPVVHAELLPAPSSPQILLPRIEAVAESNARAEGVRREICISKAVIHAEEQLAEDPQEPPSAQVNDDWLLRWRDCAANVSSDELQSLWGKVLAGEIKAPGRYSLRTLEFLRNLSQNEAQAIEKLSAFVISDVIYRDDKAIEAEGVPFALLLSMQELGIISGVAAVGLEISWGSLHKDRFERPLVSHGRVLMVKHADPARILKLQIYQVTSLGRQVLRLGTFQTNESYLRTLGAKIQAEGFEVGIGTYAQVSENQIKLLSMEPL